MSELPQEKSIEFAAQFEMLKLSLNILDWEYAEQLVKGLKEQVQRQKTLSILNPGYPLAKNDLIYKQAEALKKFCEGVRLLQECDEMKENLETETATRKEIARMFL